MADENVVYAPQIPYTAVIPGGMFAGNVIVMKGMATTGAKKRFAINVTCGPTVEGEYYRDNVALHFNPRFDTHELVLNTLIHNSWGPEEIYGNPFSQGHPFEMRIVALTDRFKISLNGRHLCDYVHRVPLRSANTLHVWGAVQFDYLRFEGGIPEPTPGKPSPPVHLHMHF